MQQYASSAWLVFKVKAKQRWLIGRPSIRLWCGVQAANVAINSALKCLSFSVKLPNIIPSSHYMTFALIFKSLMGLMSFPTRAPDQRLIRDGSRLAGACWSTVCELFKDARREARRCVPDAAQISGMLNVLPTPKKSNGQWETCSDEGNKKSKSPAVICSSSLNPVLFRYIEMPVPRHHGNKIGTTPSWWCFLISDIRTLQSILRYTLHTYVSVHHITG